MTGMSAVLREGALLGERYRLERMLGTGGMATVWLAHDERLKRPVAAKILSDTLAADPSYLRRFRREARLAAGLSHANLVEVYDFGGEGDRPYLAMEYVEGGSVADRISAGTARGLDSCRLARELLEALDHIHGAGIVHRDVKPGNVLLATDGTAKLADFGIAQPEGATRLTSTGLVVGTRSYLAPEVARGEPATVRSDLYSCGMVLREAFGDPPPTALAELVTRLVDQDPEQRPESASRALAALGSETTGPTQPLAARTVGARPRTLAGMAILAVLTVIGLILLSSGDDTSSTGDRVGERSQQQAPPAEQPGDGDGSAPAGEPRQGSGTSKEKKPRKTPPGKAKGHKKH